MDLADLVDLEGLEDLMFFVFSPLGGVEVTALTLSRFDFFECDCVGVGGAEMEAEGTLGGDRESFLVDLEGVEVVESVGDGVVGFGKGSSVYIEAE